MTSSIIETMMNIRITPMSMKTVMKKRRRKTEEEKKEKLINMSKVKKLMKTKKWLTSSTIETMMNIRATPMDEYEDSDEEDEKEDRRREKGEIDEYE